MSHRRTAAPRPVHVVLPGGVDDPAAPSGGNAYDRRVCDGLAAAGDPVHELAVPGSWPHPDAEARAGLHRKLTALPDGAVVLCDGLVACGVPDIVVPHARRLRLAVLVHLPLGDEAGQGPHEAATLHARERQVLRAATATVTTSFWTGRRLIAHHGLDASRVHVATPGTEPAPPAAGTDGVTRLLCVGSVTPSKAQDLLVEALASIPDLPFRCVCVGPWGRDLTFVAHVRGLVGQHHPGDRVWLTGPLTGGRLAAEYAAADLLVLPSRTETYGMVVAEALARATPVLATSVGGVPDTLGSTPDGSIPGILVPPNDPTALAAALRRWFDQPLLRRHLRDTARERRTTLGTWQETTRRIAAVLETCRQEPL